MRLNATDSRIFLNKSYKRICHSLKMSDFELSRRRLYPLYATVLRFAYAMADDYAETKRE